jgi:hypothetical protein
LLTRSTLLLSLLWLVVLHLLDLKVIAPKGNQEVSRVRSLLKERSLLSNEQLSKSNIKKKLMNFLLLLHLCLLMLMARSLTMSSLFLLNLQLLVL